MLYYIKEKIMDVKKYIIKKENQYDYFDVFSYIKDFIHLNDLYHLTHEEIMEKIYAEIDKQIPHLFHKLFIEASVKRYMDENKELFLILGNQQI
jgi:hypothetical protein